MPLYIAKRGDLEGCHACLTDSLTDSHLKDRATQLLIKYKSGALVTQFLLVLLVLLTDAAGTMLGSRQSWAQYSFRFVYLLIKLSPLYNIPQTQWYTTPVVGFVRALNVGQEGITT